MVLGQFPRDAAKDHNEIHMLSNITELLESITIAGMENRDENSSKVQ